MNDNLARLPDKFQRARAYHQKGDLTNAQSLYEEILDSLPNHVDALHLLGIIAGQSKRPEKALEYFDRAIAVEPSNAKSHYYKGSAHMELRDWENAIAGFNQAVAINADFVEAYHSRGYALLQLERFDDALTSYDRAIAIRPNLAGIHCSRGVVLQAQKRFFDAVASFDRAITLQPDYSEALLSRGNVLMDLGRYESALNSYDRLIALNTECAEAHCNRGAVLRALGRAEAALASHDRAIAIKSDYAEAYLNRGIVLIDLGQWDAALADYNRAIAANPEFVEAHANKAALLLSRGDWANGWIEYEWRTKMETVSVTGAPRRFSEPLWRGQESLLDKTILLYSEQGFGDIIQFCRYSKLVAALGARVILEVPEALAGLLAGLEGVSQLVTSGSPLPRFDFQCPLVSLPLAFKTELASIPAAPSYIRADASKIAAWRRNLGGQRAPRIGLAWSGSPRHANDRNRSIPLADIAPHLPPEFRYVSLQPDVRPADREALDRNVNIMDPSRELLDFSDTAALCECMDLVVSVDTSVAHLGAALGKSTWILLPVVPDWRWLLDRDDSPWYPTVTLYRQRKAGDWKGALQRIGTDLIRRFTGTGVTATAPPAVP
jgi:tetratricopeptide (TPR) repeat protein